MSAGRGSKSCGSTAEEASTVVTVAQSPPSRWVRSLHWLTETTTSTSSPGQRAASPDVVTGRLPAPLAAVQAVVASPASTARTTTTPRARPTSPPLDGNDSHNQYAGSGRGGATGLRPGRRPGDPRGRARR